MFPLTTNLPVVDTLDRGPHFPQLRVIKMTHLLNLLLEPLVVLLLDGSSDLLLVNHLLLGGVLLPLQGAQLVQEPESDGDVT